MATVSSSANATERSVPAGVPAGATAAAATRLARIRKAAASRGIPLAAIVTAVAVVALTYLAGKAPLPAAGRHSPDGARGVRCLDLEPLRAVPANLANPP